MAPEHRAAFAAVVQGRPLPDDLDGRADVFGLGTTLAELLRRGERPTTGLADVIARSVAADAADRYPTADDLRRHLADLPWGAFATATWAKGGGSGDDAGRRLCPSPSRLGCS